jgi:hypothetical protein
VGCIDHCHVLSGLSGPPHSAHCAVFLGLSCAISGAVTSGACGLCLAGTYQTGPGTHGSLHIMRLRSPLSLTCLLMSAPFNLSFGLLFLSKYPCSSHWRFSPLPPNPLSQILGHFLFDEASFAIYLVPRGRPTFSHFRFLA